MPQFITGCLVLTAILALMFRVLRPRPAKDATPRVPGLGRYLADFNHQPRIK